MHAELRLCRSHVAPLPTGVCGTSTGRTDTGPWQSAQSYLAAAPVPFRLCWERRDELAGRLHLATNRNHMRLFVLAMLIGIACSASAQVYRCTTPTGKVEYSGAPCDSHSRDARVVVAPLSEADRLRQENETLRRQLQQQEQQNTVQQPLPVRRAIAQPEQATPTPAVGRTQADIQADRADSRECARAKREYEVALSSISERNTSAAAEVAMYSACGMRNPDRTTINIRRGPSNCHYVGAILICN